MVWEILADVNNWPSNFTPYLKEAHLDGGIEVGAKGWVQTRIPIPKAPFEISAVVPEKSWAWTGKILWLTMTFDHIVEATSDGTRVTFDVDLDGPLASVFRPLFRLQYRPNMETALDGLVAEAERRS